MIAHQRVVGRLDGQVVEVPGRAAGAEGASLARDLEPRSADEQGVETLHRLVA